MSKVNKKLIYCKFCGLELENGVCECGADFTDEKNTNEKKKKCDTCKKAIDVDSKFCPYCGIPVGTSVYSDELKKELRGDFEKDVLADLKKGKSSANNGNNEIFSSGIKKIIGLFVIVLVLLFVIKGITVVKERHEVKQYQQELMEDLTEISETVAETKTYYNARTDEQKTIPIRDNWIRQNGYFYCLDKEGNPIIDDWVKEKDTLGNTIYYYFDIDGRLVVNSWIDGEYYVGEDGIMYADQMTPDGAYVDKTGKIVINDNNKGIPVELQETRVYYELPEVGAAEKPVNQSSSSSGQLKGVDPNKTYELYIKEIRKIKDTYKTETEKYSVTYYYPIIAGEKEKEVNKINELISDMFDGRFKNIVHEMKDAQNKLPKSIILNTVEQRQVNQNRFIFIVSGKLAPRSGLSEKKKFRFVYDRKSKTIDLLDISSY